MKASRILAVALTLGLAAWPAAAEDRDVDPPCASAAPQRSDAQRLAQALNDLHALRVRVRAARADLAVATQRAPGRDQPGAPPTRTLEDVDARVAAIERRMDRMEAAMDDVVEMMAEIVMQLLDDANARPDARAATTLPVQPNCAAAPPKTP